MKKDDLFRLYSIIGMYISMIQHGYSVSDDEILNEIQKIMKGGRTPARADAPAGVPYNADCTTSRLGKMD